MRATKNISFTHKGSRSHNQDAFFESEKLFIVCDGVGGLSYGDVAAKLACSSFSEYFKENPAESYDCEYVNKALQYTIEKFQETVSKYPETKDMSTTEKKRVYRKRAGRKRQAIYIYLKE
jgi:serine/threonine protein phosphatase PrpC